MQSPKTNHIVILFLILIMLSCSKDQTAFEHRSNIIYEKIIDVTNKRGDYMGTITLKSLKQDNLDNLPFSKYSFSVNSDNEKSVNEGTTVRNVKPRGHRQSLIELKGDDIVVVDLGGITNKNILSIDIQMIEPDQQIDDREYYFAKGTDYIQVTNDSDKPVEVSYYYFYQNTIKAEKEPQSYLLSQPANVVKHLHKDDSWWYCNQENEVGAIVKVNQAGYYHFNVAWSKGC